MSKQWSAEDFWQFSVDTYSNANIQKCCLALQNEVGLNVNLLLLCCYLEQMNVHLAEEEILILRRAIKTSELTIQNHRKMRKDAKSQNSTSYNTLLAQELELEKQQQYRLVDTIQTLRLQKDQGANLRAYLYSSNIEDASIKLIAQKYIDELQTLTTN